MKPYKTALVVGLGVLGIGAIFAARSSQAAPPGPTPPGPTPPGPSPAPGPGPGPVPPPSNLDQLRAFESQLLAAVAANPADPNLDPNAMRQAAAEFDSLGLKPEGDKLRAAAAAVDAARGGLLPPIPNPTPP